MTMDRALIDWYRRFPEGWWGYHWAPPQPMSAVELIGTPAIDSAPDGDPLGGRRAPTGRDAGERGAAGRQDDDAVAPSSTSCPTTPSASSCAAGGRTTTGSTRSAAGTGYLLINEMSDHLPIYVWGRAARGALCWPARAGASAPPCTPTRCPRRSTACARSLGATDAGPRRPDDLPAVLRLRDARRACIAAWRRPGTCASMPPARWRRCGSAAIDGERSPRLTGAQRLPAPPMLPDDGGRSRPPVRPRPRAPTRCSPAAWALEPDDLEAELAERAAFLEDLAERGICDAAVGRARRGRLSERARHRVRR